MIDREKLLTIVQDQQIDYSQDIDITQIANILLQYWDVWFYIEELRSEAGEWWAYMYLDYYDETLHHIVMVEEIYYQLSPEYDNIHDNLDVVEYILLLEKKVLNLSDKITKAMTPDL